MATYGKIDVSMWGDRKFRALSGPAPNAQTLWTYLLAPRERLAIPGLIPVGVATLAESLRWPVEATRACFDELVAMEMAEIDPDGPLIRLPNAIHHNLPENPNVVKGWGKRWGEVPECALKHKAWASLKQVIDALPTKETAKVTFAAAFAESFPEPGTEPYPQRSSQPSLKRSRKRSEERHPTPSPEPSPKPWGKQEQEQEQEQEAAAAARAPARVEPEVPAPPRPQIAPADDDIPLPRKMLIVDRSAGLGPLGSEYRGLVERDLGHGLALAAAAAVRDELEAQVERWGGPERAAAWTVATALSRPAGKRPASVEWCVKLLRESTPPPAARKSADDGRWWARLAREDLEQYERERAEIDPELRDAPFGAEGTKHERAVRALHERWKARTNQAAGGA